jgi:primosomal protein N' (replication factor Y)
VGSHRGDAIGRAGTVLIQIAQVVPDLATFAVDDGFAYRVPPGLEVEVGALVRIPLGGRRVRGFVVGLRSVDRQDAPARLKDVAARSGDLAVFDARMLETLRWAAIHYVGPLAVVLGRTAPPNLPRPIEGVTLPAVANADAPALSSVVSAAVAGLHTRPTMWIGPGPWADPIGDLLAPVLAAGRSAMVVLPTSFEAKEAADRLRERFGGRVVTAGSALSAKQATAAWGTAASRAGVVLVGTREIALWRVAELSLAVVVEEGRRAMKSPQTPALHVRDVLRRRATVERFSLVTAGPVPTTEMLAAGAAAVASPGRSWRLVEVVDRREDLDGGALITDRARRAIRTVADRGGRVFCLVHRRGYAPAFRCVACGEVRRCATCGAAVDRDGSCRRCRAAAGTCAHCGGSRFAPLGAGVGRVIDDLKRSVGDRVGTVEERRPVAVGTERDLVQVQPVDLAVLIDADGWLLAPNYRAEEDAIRIIARLASRVAPGSGRRAMLQTTQPEHRVVAAARRGDAMELLRVLLEERAALGFPPSGELIAIEVGNPPDDADHQLRETIGADAAVLGPAETGDGTRWLVQGRALHSVRVRLRRLVQQWRDADARVRVDADPVDL